MISSDVRDIVSSLQRIARALEGINSCLRGISHQQLPNIAQPDEDSELNGDDPGLLSLIAALSKK